MCERTPLAEVLLLPVNGARKLVDGVLTGDFLLMMTLKFPGNGAKKLLDVCVGYPKLKVMMMHNSKFSLSMKPMFNRTRRRRESLLKVLLADFSNGARKEIGRASCRERV